jgi:hypothetical protein
LKVAGSTVTQLTKTVNVCEDVRVGYKTEVIFKVKVYNPVTSLVASAVTV